MRTRVEKFENYRITEFIIDKYEKNKRRFNCSINGDNFSINIEYLGKYLEHKVNIYKNYILRFI